MAGNAEFSGLDKLATLAASAAASAANKIEAVVSTTVNPFEHIESAFETKSSAALRKTSTQLTKSVDTAALALYKFNEVRERLRYSEQDGDSLLDETKLQAKFATATLAFSDLQQSSRVLVDQILCNKLEDPDGEYKLPMGSAQAVLEALYSGSKAM